MLTTKEEAIERLSRLDQFYHHMLTWEGLDDQHLHAANLLLEQHKLLAWMAHIGACYEIREGPDRNVRRTIMAINVFYEMIDVMDHGCDGRILKKLQRISVFKKRMPKKLLNLPENMKKYSVKRLLNGYARRMEAHKKDSTIVTKLPSTLKAVRLRKELIYIPTMVPHLEYFVSTYDDTVCDTRPTMEIDQEEEEEVEEQVEEEVEVEVEKEEEWNDVDDAVIVIVKRKPDHDSDFDILEEYESTQGDRYNPIVIDDDDDDSIVISKRKKSKY